MPSPTSPVPGPTIGALFRQLERRAGNSSSTSTCSNSDDDRDDSNVMPLDILWRDQRKMSSYDDRTLHVPRHAGRNILPCHPFFNRLVRFAHAVPARLCIRDTITGVEATHVQLLTDVLRFRQVIWEGLHNDAKKRLDQRQEVYIAVLAPGGYEFAVATLAILALGAAVVPMTVAVAAHEALYFINKSRASAVLVSKDALRLGVTLEKLVKDQDPASPFVVLPVTPYLKTPRLQPTEIKVSSDLYLDDNAPGVVIFTSGTTGPPKGAVMRRGFIFDEALGVVDHYHITTKDVLLHVLPVHHATGIGMMFFPFLVAGALLEFRSGSFSSEWVWERWRRGGTTFFSGVPTIYMRLMRFFQQNLAARPDVHEYISGAQSLRACLCGTSALPGPIADFWTELLGRPILLRYGMTETGAVFKVRMGDDAPYGSVGNVFAGCDVRLSEGDEGEIFVKSPGMFSKFLFDAKATSALHTEDGYYKTGDIARKEGGYYWILGRASVDIIKSGGYKMSALDIEREIMGLPYVAEVMVVGIPDEEFGERVGAAICLKKDQDMPPGDRKHAVHHLAIEKLRNDLRSRISGYKMPTVLRILPDELPKSGATGKVAKKVLGPQLFPAEMRHTPEIQIWSREREEKPKAKL